MVELIHKVALLAPGNRAITRGLSTHCTPPPLRQRTSELWWLSGGLEGILSEQLCAGLCDTVFTVSSTLMWAVLTGQTDWVCHTGILTLCVEAVASSCIIVKWRNGSGGIQAWSLTTNWFPSLLWHCWFGHLACKNRPRNDLLCVEWDVKPYTLTYSTTVRCRTKTRPSADEIPERCVTHHLIWLPTYLPLNYDTSVVLRKIFEATRITRTYLMDVGLRKAPCVSCYYPFSMFLE